MLQSENSKAKHLPALFLTITLYQPLVCLSHHRPLGPGRAYRAGPSQMSSRNASRSYAGAILNAQSYSVIKLSMILPIRRSVGYYGPIANIAATTNHRSLLPFTSYSWQRNASPDDRHDNLERRRPSPNYSQACLYALEMEYAELDDLERIANR